jgi:vacuolar protein sorting-associated protein 54
VNKELINKSNHAKLSNSLKDLMASSSDYAQERLVNLLEVKFSSTFLGQENYTNSLDKLSSNDFISLSNLIDQFIIDFDQITNNKSNVSNKKVSALGIWIQNQANKYLYKFHSEKKEKLILALNSERWKQTEIPAEIQNLVDNIIKNNELNKIMLLNQKIGKALPNNGDYLLINEEKYIVVSSVIVLIKLMIEYCQFVIDIPNMSFDTLNRLVELFKVKHYFYKSSILNIFLRFS